MGILYIIGKHYGGTFTKALFFRFEREQQFLQQVNTIAAYGKVIIRNLLFIIPYFILNIFKYIGFRVRVQQRSLIRSFGTSIRPSLLQSHPSQLSTT